MCGDIVINGDWIRSIEGDEDRRCLFFYFLFQRHETTKVGTRCRFPLIPSHLPLIPRGTLENDLEQY